MMPSSSTGYANTENSFDCAANLVDVNLNLQNGTFYVISRGEDEGKEQINKQTRIRGLLCRIRVKVVSSR